MSITMDKNKLPNLNLSQICETRDSVGFCNQYKKGDGHNTTGERLLNPISLPIRGQRGRTGFCDHGTIIGQGGIFSEMGYRVVEPEK